MKLGVQRCAWWRRGRHQRLRGADIEILWPTLVAKAETMDEARVAWDVFLGQVGQDHWHCPCGLVIAELFRTVTITVAE